MFERASTIIRDGSKLDFDYVPGNLVHRESQMARLETLFRPLAERGRPCTAFLTGSVGTGKTVTAARFRADLTEYMAKAGRPMDSVYINCRNQYAHESTAEHPWTLMWVHFNGNGADDFYQTYQEQERGSIFHPPDPAPFTDSLTALYSLMHEKPSLMELYAHRYLTDLITLCFTEGRPGTDREDSLSPKLLSVRQYLEEHYMEKISLEQLSSRFFISKYHLSREYKKHYGITIGNDLTARRLSHAKSLLRFSDGSIEGIATACGFSDAGYFIKVFRRSEGMTPLEYRRNWELYSRPFPMNPRQSQWLCVEVFRIFMRHSGNNSRQVRFRRHIPRWTALNV